MSGVIVMSFRVSCPWKSCSASGMLVESSLVNTVLYQLFNTSVISLSSVTKLFFSSFRGPTLT